MWFQLPKQTGSWLTLGALMLSMIGCATPTAHVTIHTDGYAAAALKDRPLIGAADGSFELRVPAGWRITDGAQEDTLVLLRGEAASEGVITVRSFEPSGELTDEVLTSIQEGAVEGLKRQLPGLMVTHVDVQAEANRTLHRVNYHSRLRGAPMSGRFALIYQEDGLFSVNAVTPEAYQDTLDSAMDGILMSLKGLKEKPQAPAVSEVYQAPQDKFSFVMPQGWQFDLIQPSAQVDFHRFEARDGTRARLMVVQAEIPLGERLNEKHITALERGLFTQLQADQPQLVKTEAITLSGQPAVARAWQFEREGQWHYLREVYQLRGSTLFSLTQSGPYAFQEAQDGAFDQVVRTFSVPDQKGRRSVARR
ncbi:MAG: hypothetical protein ACKO6N_27175 [Myxococcota bacterium]